MPKFLQSIEIFFCNLYVHRLRELFALRSKIKDDQINHVIKRNRLIKDSYISNFQKKEFINIIDGYIINN